MDAEFDIFINYFWILEFSYYICGGLDGNMVCCVFGEKPGPFSASDQGAVNIFYILNTLW